MFLAPGLSVGFVLRDNAACLRGLLKKVQLHGGVCTVERLTTRVRNCVQEGNTA